MLSFVSEEVWQDRSRIRDIQSERLVELLTLVSSSNPFWKKRFAETGVDAASIRSVDDLDQLPVTMKHHLMDDQAADPPYGTNLTYPIDTYSRLHQTSGTTGLPLRCPDTPADWDWFMECWRQKYNLIRLRPDDRLFFAFSFGPFIGFWAAFEGASRLGYMCIPGGGLSTLRRLEMIDQNSATVVCCVPTYAMRMADVAKQHGFDLAASSVRLVIVAGEPGGSIPSVRRRIEEAWGARVIDHWGMTEIGSLATEHVDDPSGLMVLETEAIAEIVARETFEPVATGEIGELLLTNLGRHGAPLFRYRTGDLVRAATAPSPTGIQLTRLEGGVVGRVDQMITIRGNNVFPSSIEAVVREFDEVAEFRIDVTTVRAMQHLRLEIEPAENLSDVPELLKRIGTRLHGRLGFQVDVTGVAPGSLPRFEMKARRFHRE
jgi:phenylacetate-CoA ligase